MNVNTGHLIDTKSFQQDEFRELMKNGYQPVPIELEKAANEKLAGQKEVMVSLDSTCAIGKWAAKERKDKKAKRKATQESQRRNRGR